MKYTKLFVGLVLFFISFLWIHPSIYASDFETHVDTTFTIEESGSAHVEHILSVENRNSEKYLSDFILKLSGFSPTNTKAFKNGKGLRAVEIDNDGTTSILVQFDNPVIGVGNTQDFRITYDVENFASQFGEVWEFTVPQLEHNHEFATYDVHVVIPKKFGNIAYLYPQPDKQVETNASFELSYTREQVEKQDIVAGFGIFQVYSLRLMYHLDNTEDTSKEFEVAFPPDTFYQNMYYKSINPEPFDMKRDADGNWIGIYKLAPHEEIDIVVDAIAQVLHEPKETFDSPVLPAYTQPSEFWNTDDPKISQIGTYLQTPQKIYDYTVTNLSYNYARQNENTQRLGSLEALTNPDKALCSEYSDLFIALSRSGGIPSREINGYALTTDPKLEPVSLVRDVLHSWVEYWDEDRHAWISIDPTWGSTTGNDYFNSFDFRHIAFVIHGENPQSPIPPGAYKTLYSPEKDVFVGYGELPIQRKSVVDVTIDDSTSLALRSKKLSITLKNTGPSAIYDENFDTYFDEDLFKEIKIDALLPLQTKTFDIEVPVGFLATQTPSVVNISFYGSEAHISTHKQTVLLFHLFILATILLVAILLVLFKAKKFPFVKR